MEKIDIVTYLKKRNKKLKEYKKQRYREAKESKNNKKIHIFRQTDGNKSLIVYI